MASLFEDIALYAFAHETGIRPVRRRMKEHILATIDPSGKRRAGDEFLAEIAAVRRTPDAVAVLSAEVAAIHGLQPRQTVLFIEAEHSAPLTEEALTEYTSLWMNSDDMGSDTQVAVVVVERYGRLQWLDLGALSFALHVRRGLDLDFAMEALRSQQTSTESM